MGRLDYHETYFSIGKLILCLLISILFVGLAVAVYLVIAGILSFIPGIIVSVIFLALLIIVSLFLKNYSYSSQGPSFISVFIVIILVAFIAALATGIGPLRSVKESILSSFKTTPMQVVQTASPTQEPSSNTITPKPTEDKAVVPSTSPTTPITVPPTTTPTLTTTPPANPPITNAPSPPSSNFTMIVVPPMPGGEKGVAGISSTVQNPSSTSSPPSAAIDALENALSAQVNSLRQQNGAGILQKISYLDGMAREHSQYMFEHGQISHDGFLTDRSPTIISTMKVSMVGENVLYVPANLTDVQQIADVWYQSPDHRANMLSTGFKRTGIGIVIGNGRIYATQIFTN